MKKFKTKTINLPCNCAGGSRSCGFLQIINFFDGTFEICWVKKSTAKKAKVGIFLDDTGMKKLRDFINIIKK